MNPDAGPKHISRFEQTVRFFCVAYVLICACAIWRYDLFPSQDGPGHLTDARYMSDASFRDGETVRQWYRPDWRQYATNSIGQWILVLGMRFTSPEQAEKALATLCLLLFASGALSLCRALSPRWGPGSVAAVLFATLHQALFLGFYNWILGCAAGMFLLSAWWKKRHRLTWRNALPLAAGWTGVFYAHAFAFSVFAAAMAAMAAADAGLSGRKRSDVLRSAGWTAASLVPAALFTLWLGRLMPAARYLFVPAVELWKDLLTLECLTFWSRNSEPHATALAWILTALFITSLLTFPRVPDGAKNTHSQSNDILTLPAQTAWLAGLTAVLLIGWIGPAGSLTENYAQKGWINGNRGTFTLSSRVMALIPIFAAPWLDFGVWILRRVFCLVLAAGCVFHAFYAFEPVERHVDDIQKFRQALKQVPPGSLIAMIGTGRSVADSSGARLSDPMTQPGFFITFDSKDSVYLGALVDKDLRRKLHPSVFPHHAFKRAPSDDITHLIGWKTPENAEPAGYRMVHRSGGAFVFERRPVSPSASAHRPDKTPTAP